MSSVSPGAGAWAQPGQRALYCCVLLPSIRQTEMTVCPVSSGVKREVLLKIEAAAGSGRSAASSSSLEPK